MKQEDEHSFSSQEVIDYVFLELSALGRSLAIFELFAIIYASFRALC